MRIAIGADHAGYLLKKDLIDFFKKKYEMMDMGTASEENPVDYPDYACLVAQKVLKNEANFGILICGTGVGMSIAANRYKGIRAALCNCGPETAHLARQHNNANIICLGARLIDLERAQSCVDVFLTTSFEEGRHQRRLNKIEALS